MDNLFVVDASIFPEMITTNPSALIVSVAEHASEKILALEGSSSAGNTTVVPEVAPVASNATLSAQPTAPLSTGTVSIEVPAGNNATVAAPTATSAAEPLTTAAEATSVAEATSAASSAAAPSASSAGGSTEPQKEWATCGGNSDYKGSTTCAEGLTCKKWNDYYSQCVKA